MIDRVGRDGVRMSVVMGSWMVDLGAEWDLPPGWAGVDILLPAWVVGIYSDVSAGL